MLRRAWCVIIERDQRLIPRILNYIKLIFYGFGLPDPLFILLVQKRRRGFLLGMMMLWWDRMAKEHGQGLLLCIIQVRISRMCENLIKAILRRYSFNLFLCRVTSSILLIPTQRHSQLLLSIIPILRRIFSTRFSYFLHLTGHLTFILEALCQIQVAKFHLVLLSANVGVFGVKLVYRSFHLDVRVLDWLFFFFWRLLVGS